MTDPSLICVFTGSSPGADPRFAAVAADLGTTLVRRGHGLVYGGGSVGLMGVVADAVLAAGGRVVGVLPQALDRREVAHRGLSELRIVADMHERKATMARLAEGFVTLPGGLGTLEELAEIATWNQLGLQAKPVGLLDVAGFWRDLDALLDHMVRERFVRPQHRALLLRDTTPDGLLDQFAAWRPPSVEKWLTTDEAPGVAPPPRGPLVGVSAVVVRDGRVLLGRRRGAHGAATFAFPGGKLDAGEAPAAAVARELEEETGLVATAVAPISWTDDRFPDEGLHYVTLHHRVEVAGGAEPELREPDKSEAWSWSSWDALPTPLFGPAAGLVATGWTPA